MRQTPDPRARDTSSPSERVRRAIGLSEHDARVSFGGAAVTIIVADDDRTVSHLMCTLLRDRGLRGGRRVRRDADPHVRDATACAAFLPKPIDPERFVAAVRDALGETDGARTAALE